MKTINEQIYDALEETMHPASIPHVDYDGCDLRLDGEFSVSDLEKIIQVINGDYEPKIKTVSLDWLVDIGIDCEFSDDGQSWHVDVLIGGDKPWYLSSKGRFAKCRPRMNNQMVLTDEQVKLIPDSFDCTSYTKQVVGLIDNLNIVTFKGLKDNYKYEWEA